MAMIIVPDGGMGKSEVENQSLRLAHNFGSSHLTHLD